MKKLKKIISVAIASAGLVAGTSLPVSADYHACDVDRNGYVNIADLIYVNKYLLGIYSISNYNHLDVNRSLTVDAADEKCLTKVVLGGTYKKGAYFSRKTGDVVSSPTVSGFTPSKSSSSTEPRAYIRCRYDDNGEPTALSDYTLTPTPMTLNGGVSPRAIIGEDDRKPSFNPENTGLVWLDSIGGTGFIVGDHQIATAAHCVFKNNTWRKMRINTMDSNGCKTNTTLHPVEAHVPKSCINGGPTEDDYALITVSDDLSEYVHFSLGTPYNVSELANSNIPVYVTGCPGEIPNSGGRPNSENRLYWAEGNVVYNSSDKTDALYYDVDASGGDSGSPVYTITKIDNEYIYTAIAIHHGLGISDVANIGSMITNYHIQFYKNNPYASYSSN